MKEKDILEKFHFTKSQILEIIENYELPKAPKEVRIQNVGNDKFLIIEFDNQTGEGGVLYRK